MTINAASLYAQEFATRTELLLQQKGSKLRPFVSMGTHVGKQASPVDQLGAIEAQTPTGRFAPRGRVDAPVARRWVHPIDKDLPQLFDSFDKLRIISDPKSKYAENAANAIGRAYDYEIIRAALATSVTGETGTGSEAFDTTNFSIAANFQAAAATGLTVAKLIEARRMFEQAFVDVESDPLTLIISARQHANLLNQAQTQSRDFTDRPSLVSGRVTSFLGFNIVVSEYLTKVGNDRYNIAFAKSGLYLGVWEEMVSKVSQRDDLSGQPWQHYVKTTFGGTRIEQGKVVRILATE
jgi:hypothetical protein